MLEYEKKIPITYGQFIVLQKLIAKNSKAHKQTNFYYDTDDLSMNRQGITCRIREKNGKYTATVKQHGYYSFDCSIETSSPVKNEFDDSLFIEKDIKLQGSLMTERTYFICEEDFEVVIDKNTYLGFTDYEIEIEYAPVNIIGADKTIALFADFLNSKCKNFNYTEFYEKIKSAKNKSSRFFERLTAIKFKTEGDNL